MPTELVEELKKFSPEQIKLLYEVMKMLKNGSSIEKAEEYFREKCEILYGSN